MATKRTSNWRGKVSTDAHKSLRKSRGYLNLPDGIKELQFEDDTKKVLIDILPYVVTDSNHPNRDVNEGIALKGDLWYKRPFKIHKDVGADNEKCVCPKSVGKPCPICDYQKKRFNEGADKEETKELYPKDRNLYAVVHKDGKEPSEIFVWDMSQSLFQDILKDALDEDPNYEVFPDLEEGLTLEVALKWKTFGKAYYPEARNINFIERKKGYPESILDEVPDLDNVLKVLTYEELSNKFFEMDNEPVSTGLKDVEEDTAPPRRERKVEPKEEAPAPERKRKSAAAKEEPAPKEEKDEKVKWSELLNMSYRNLIRMCISNDLNLPIDDYIEADADSIQALREDIAKELDVEIPKKEPAPRQRKSTPEPDANERCPFKHRFGVDTEKFDDCDTCEIWKDCIAEKSKKK